MTDSNIDKLQGIRNNILENVNNPDLLKWHVNDLDTLIYKIKQGKNYDSLDNVSVSSLQRYEVNVSRDGGYLLDESGIGGLVLWDDVNELLNSR